MVDKKNQSDSHERKKVTVALQGGGAYGAFTWGVLDRLLQDERIEIVGISGVSAGSMNAVALAHGLDKGGNKGARETLAKLWHALSFEDFWAKLPGGTLTAEFARQVKKWDMTGLSDQYTLERHAKLLEQMGVSVNDEYMNLYCRKRLQEKLLSVIDFGSLQKNQKGVPVSVGATNIKTHAHKTFHRHEMDINKVLASCSLPGFFKPMKIDDEEYWDGAMSANPSLRPLKDTEGSDILVIQTTPILTAADRNLKNQSPDQRTKLIGHFLTAITRHEIENIALDNERVHKFPKAAAEMGIREFRAHLIQEDKMPAHDRLGYLNFDWGNLQKLHDLGFKAADKWLKENFDKIGHESTADLLVDFERYKCEVHKKPHAKSKKR